MQTRSARPGSGWKVLGACTLGCLLPIVAHAEEAAASTPTPVDNAALRARIEEHRRALDDLKRRMEAEERDLQAIERALAGDAPLATGDRGRTNGSAAPLTPAGTPTAAGIDSGQPQAAQQPAGPVGRAPDAASTMPSVATIFEEPGVLTQKGHVVLEPSLQYAYSSNNRVALLGYSIIPALVVGLIDVREVKSNTLTGALAGRFGVTNRFELEARVPYVYRADDTISREVGSGSATDRVFSTRGQALGDIDMSARYQLNEGSASLPFFVASLRYKSRTGRSPFDVVTDCVTRCVGTNVTGTGLPLTEPTGSGFDSIQPGLTWLLPSDPAVFFGNFSYLHNFGRNVSRLVLNGEREPLGFVEPGDVIGFNFGMGLALNDKSSFSVGYDHSSVGPAKQAGVRVPGSVRIELGTLVLGYSLRVTPSTTVNLSVGAGLTSDTPGLTLTLRVPLML